MRLVLASTSQYRRALLDAAGIRYEAVSPPFVEEHGHAREPSELVVELARGKAESLAAQLPDALILGADQIPAVDGRVLTKPGSRDAAIEQLRALSGREHRLFTAVAVHEPASGRTLTRTVIHVMRMRALTEAQLAAYVDRDQPFDCAGAYKVEAAGALLFEAMEGVDHTAIVGLPLTAVAELLLAFGHDVLG
ncbi:MAG: septum formation protein Maf [Deltaproteobacteria bacterium]|nr:septum formation protein Maf [Deltaproteobacteria bacterium]